MDLKNRGGGCLAVRMGSCIRVMKKIAAIRIYSPRRQFFIRSISRRIIRHQRHWHGASLDALLDARGIYMEHIRQTCL